MDDSSTSTPDQPSALTSETAQPPAPQPRRKNKPGAGRPRTEINWQAFDAMCFSHSTLLEMADFFQCSPDTLERAVKREFHQNFADVFRYKSARGKISLRRTMWDTALRRHDTRMMIWLSKQHLGMREVVEMDVAERYPITPEIEAKDRETLEREIREFLAGIDFGARLRKAEARAIKERKARQAQHDQTKSLSEPSAVTQPVPAAAQEPRGGTWPTRRDVAALNAAEKDKKES